MSVSSHRDLSGTGVPASGLPAAASLRPWTEYARIALGLLVGAVFVVLVLRMVDLRETGALLQRASLPPLVFALLAFVLDFVLRAWRFWAMLKAVHPGRLPFWPTVGPFVASFGISDILPLRVGDGFRVLWFNRRFGTPVASVVGAMIAERVLDLATILILGAVALLALGTTASPEIVLKLHFVLAVAIAGSLGLLCAPSVLSRVLRALSRGGRHRWAASLVPFLQLMSDAILRIGSLSRLLMFFAVSLALWVLESAVVLGAWLSLGGPWQDMIKPFAAFCFSTLGTLVPSLPGHFGAFEFFGLQAFGLAGVEPSMAAAVLLLAHLILWAPTALFGVLWLLLGGRRR